MATMSPDVSPIESDVEQLGTSTPGQLVDDPDDQPSVDNTAEFVSKQLADMGEEEEDLQVFVWDIPRYDALGKKEYSQEFSCGGHQWSILLFPTGNLNGQANEMVSVYLNYNDKQESTSWHVCAQFSLAICHPTIPDLYLSSQAHHRFTPEEQDWGFTRFAELKRLYALSPQHGRPIIDNEHTRIIAHVRVLRDPTGVLWHNFNNYDSKAVTGYVGLKNQGATCYMNSLLQSLFFTGAFRDAVYQIPFEDGADTVALALQRVFYNLQVAEQPVSTNDLTRSFGWKGFDSFLQHDVQEFNRVLCDKLETKMKGTAVDGAIKNLFAGTMKSYIKCININYESSRTEDFYDIQLNVKGLRGLEDSFRDYVQVETLEGDNKYNAEGFGLQDAHKGVRFEKLPPVLHLQLKRFEYDMLRDQNVKINDRYEFPLSIDLGAYVGGSTEVSGPDSAPTPAIYNLHGVLVHSGDVHGGHYFALLKPSPTSNWFRFDDDRVIPATLKEVLEDNFGGDGGALTPLQQQQLQQKPTLIKDGTAFAKRFTNAYMLVYVRASAAAAVLPEASLDAIPPPLRTRLEAERRENEQRLRERAEQHLFLSVKVVTNAAFAAHEGFDLANFDERERTPGVRVYRVAKAERLSDFKMTAAADLGVAPSQLRLWVLVSRQNKTIRPDTYLREADGNAAMQTIHEKIAARQADLKLYAEVWDGNDVFGAARDAGGLMVFVKHFDAAAQTLRGVGPFYVGKNQRVGDALPAIASSLGFPGAALRAYEEIKPGMIDAMAPKATFEQSEIQDGDIICVQREGDVAPPGAAFRSAPDVYDFFLNRTTLTFRGLRAQQNPAAGIHIQDDAEPTFTLTLSRKQPYDELATAAARALRADPLRLRFSLAGPNGSVKHTFRRSANLPVGELIGGVAAATIYYERLEMSIVELETKKLLRIVYVGRHHRHEGVFSFLLAKNATVGDLAAEVKRGVSPGATQPGQPGQHPTGVVSGSFSPVPGRNGPKTSLVSAETVANPGVPHKIRIFEIIHGRSQRILPPSEPVRDIPEGTALYAEDIPPETEMAEDDTYNSRLVGVFHYYREPARTHGIPFQFALKRDERFADTQRRLQAALDFSDKDFAKVKCSLIQSSIYVKPMPFAEDDVLFDHKWLEDDFIGLDHTDKSNRRGVNDKAVFVK